MVNTENFFIENEDVNLEAEYFKSNSTPASGILICHPHPQMGGNMWNNVVTGILNSLIQNDITCLRFNFRGSGRSTGDHGDGEEERTDVKACINFLLNEKNIEELLICGYSYGAAVGCSTVNYSDKIIGYVSISFPWAFMGSFFKEKSQSSKPKLFIQGDRDNLANHRRFEKHYKFFNEPKEFEIIKGADHFWGGYESRLAELTLGFYKSILK